ncbi:hypothetical protein QFC20_003764 [Naganishia adeliensis]|uniref:Uncharacterized protein n=1 Tax=Naganishia adeliensis TaxID=92952 RepID=A0ACC2W658_9TREE|nr:hypothetical protein QFC20_003764 [Naganishia adeliensis]
MLTSNADSLLVPPPSPGPYASARSSLKSSRNRVPSHGTDVEKGITIASASQSLPASPSQGRPSQRFRTNVLGARDAGILNRRKKTRQSKIKIRLDGRQSKDLSGSWDSDSPSPMSTDAESDFDDEADTEMDGRDAKMLDVDAGHASEKVFTSLAKFAFKDPKS